MTTSLPTTLCLTAAALIINFWLGMRIGKLRHVHGVSVGDGGNDLILRRMRAQLNFVEQAQDQVGAVFMIGRIAHAIGMDGGFKAGRSIGMLTGTIVQLALVVVAVGASLGKF